MELTEQLIKAVKIHKILYDLSDPSYKNNRIKNKKFETKLELQLDWICIHFYCLSLNIVGKYLRMFFFGIHNSHF